ncbi:TRP-domain-containing protein [Penicillium longicatenatum]|nr:TRP-domain-containing protein [Penicillium longicatenatum]
MRLPLRVSSLWVLFLAELVSATEYITTAALQECQANSAISVSYFAAQLDRTGELNLAFVGDVSISGKITADIQLLVYGYMAVNETINLCSLGVDSLCPVSSGSLDIPQASVNISSILNDVPGIGYTVPDLDATIKIYVKNQTTGGNIACLSADLSNGHTVDQPAVSWVLAVIAGLGLCGSALSFIRGHLNTATHLSFYALALLDLMQSQAMIGLSSVKLPPIAQSWTQMFQWSIGILHIGFLQTLCTWYLRATGGTPSDIMTESKSVSVVTQKRSLIDENTHISTNLLKRATTSISSTSTTSTGSEIYLKGIRRMAYRARIEPTNIFMTSYSMFIFFGCLTVLVVLAFKFICQALSKSNKLPDRLRFAATGLPTTSRGILLRFITLVTPSAAVFCFWEFTRLDSAGELVLAITWWAGITICLGWTAATAMFHVHKCRKSGMDATYVLYSGRDKLSRKLSFLHVHYTANTFYFFAIAHLYTQVKGIVTAVTQSVPKTQAVILLVIDCIMVALVIWLRPYMDKSMNRFGIATAIFGFLNSICLLFFSEIFTGPAMMNSVIGVLFCIYNAVYMLVLVIFLIMSFVYALVLKDPERRFQRVRDNRDSFIDLHTAVPDELEDLSATARSGEEPKLPPQSSSSLLLNSHNEEHPRSRDT